MLVLDLDDPQEAVPLEVGPELGVRAAGIVAGGLTLAEDVTEPGVVGQIDPGTAIVLVNARAAVPAVVGLLLLGTVGGRLGLLLCQLLLQVVGDGRATLGADAAGVACEVVAAGVAAIVLTSTTTTKGDKCYGRINNRQDEGSPRREADQNTRVTIWTQLE